MDIVRYCCTVNVLLVFSVNICLISAILTENIAAQLYLQPAITSDTQNRRYPASDYSFAAPNTLKHLQFSENLASLPALRNNEVQNNIQTIIYTRNIPQPYRLVAQSNGQQWTKPYHVFVPKSPLLYTPTNTPQPYQFEKHRFPVRTPIDKPFLAQKPKPYSVIVQNKVVPYQIPLQLNIPVQRPIPVQIPFENPVHYTLENVVPLKFPVEHLIPVRMEKPISTPLEHVLERPHELFQLNNAANNIVPPPPASKPSPINHYQNVYDPSAHSSQVSNKVISFLPGNIQQSYSLGTIHVPEAQFSQNWNYSTTDWVPKQQYIYNKPIDHMPKTFKGHRYITSDSLASTLRNVDSFSDTAGLKESHGIKYETVKYEPLQIDVSKIAFQDLIQEVEPDKLQTHQKIINNNQLQRNLNQNSEKQFSQSNYHIFNAAPLKETKPESSINYYKLKTIQPIDVGNKWIPHTLIHNQSKMKPVNPQVNNNQQTEKVQYEDSTQYLEKTNQGKIQFQTEDSLKHVPTAHPFRVQPSNQETFKLNLEQNFPHKQQLSTEKPQVIYAVDINLQNSRENSHPQYNEPVAYNHYNREVASTPIIPQTNSHADTASTISSTQQTALKSSTTQQIQPPRETQSPNTTEIIKKNDDFIVLQKPSAFKSPESIPITYSDVTRNFVRKTRRKVAGKRKNSTRENLQ